MYKSTEGIKTHLSHNNNNNNTPYQTANCKQRHISLSAKMGSLKYLLLIVLATGFVSSITIPRHNHLYYENLDSATATNSADKSPLLKNIGGGIQEASGATESEARGVKNQIKKSFREAFEHIDQAFQPVKRYFRSGQMKSDLLDVEHKIENGMYRASKKLERAFEPAEKYFNGQFKRDFRHLGYIFQSGVDKTMKNIAIFLTKLGNLA